MYCGRLICLCPSIVYLVAVWQSLWTPLSADDWPMRGRAGTRNAVSSEKNPPTIWSVEEVDKERLIRGAQGVRWSMPLGTETHSSPVVANGLVWIGTNKRNGNGRETSSVLKCFRASDGLQVYEFVSLALGNQRNDARWPGLGSSPLVEGDRLWIATNRSEVVCLDIGPVQRGAGLPREIWRLDFVKEFATFPRVPLMGPARPCSIGASWKDRIFVTINQGISYDETKVANPSAPSLVCLNKDTGAVLWKDNSPGENILVTQFSSPTIAPIQGQVQVIVPQSDGWVRSFDPTDGHVLWEFDLNPKVSDFSTIGKGDRNYIVANAVVYEERVFIASGREPENGEGPGRLVCIDPTKRGDVSSELAVDASGRLLPRRRVQAINTKQGEKAIANRNSALVWEFVGVGNDFTELMHRTISTVAIANDLVIAADFSGLVHCLDANTGQRYWVHDTFAAIWSSPMIVDDKVFVADEEGDVAVYQLGADPRHAEPISEVLHGRYSGIYSDLAFADGTLYVATRNRLYAIDPAKAGQKSPPVSNWPQRRGLKKDNRSTDTGRHVAKAIFVPTPRDVVAKMLAVANIGKDDLVVDLGSGDGRIVIEAARLHGCHAKGIELDKDLVALSHQSIQEAKLEKLVSVQEADLFDTDFENATVVTAYLYPDHLARLLPQFAKLKPGSRIVSHQFAIPNVPPERTWRMVSQETGAEHMIHLWTTPIMKKHEKLD